MAGTTESTPEDGPRTAARAERRAERRAARLARQIGAFRKAHGAVEASVEYLGQRGARIVLVAEDGAWGDLVAPAYPIARRAVERAGLTVHDAFDGALAAKVRTGPYEWSRMAGIQIGGPANR